MKKTVVSGTILIVALSVVQLARYSSRTTAIVAEWIAVIACVFLIVLSAWSIAKLFRKGAGDASVAADPAAASAHGISSRELEVLNLVAEGLSNRQISERLFVSENTVKKHVSNLLAKLEAERRTEAVRIAFDRKLLTRL